MEHLDGIHYERFYRNLITDKEASLIYEGIEGETEGGETETYYCFDDATNDAYHDGAIYALADIDRTPTRHRCSDIELYPTSDSLCHDYQNYCNDRTNHDVGDPIVNRGWLSLGILHGLDGRSHL